MFINKYDLHKLSHIVIYTELGCKVLQMLPVLASDDLDGVLAQIPDSVTVISVVNLKEGAK